MTDQEVQNQVGGSIPPTQDIAAQPTVAGNPEPTATPVAPVKTGLIAHLEFYFAEAEHWTETEAKEAIAWLESKKL